MGQSPGQTIEQSWIPHPILLDVNVAMVAKQHPTLLHETRFRYKFALNLKHGASKKTKSAGDTNGARNVRKLKMTLSKREEPGNDKKNVQKRNVLNSFAFMHARYTCVQGNDENEPG